MGFRFVANKRRGAGGEPFHLFYKNKQGHERSRTVVDLAAAAEVLVAESRPDRSWSKLPVDALVTWIIGRVENGRDDGTPPRGAGYVKNVKNRLRKHFLPRFTGRPIGEIDVPDLTGFRLSLGSGKRPPSPQTLTSICHTVDMLFRECVECDIIAGPPPSAEAFENMRRSFRPKTIRYLDLDEVEAVMETEETDLGFVARCLLEVALREDEIAALRLEDVAGGFIHVRRVRLLDGTYGPPGNTERLRSIDIEPGLDAYFRRELAWLGLDRSLPILEQLAEAGSSVGAHQVRTRFERLQQDRGVVDDLGKAKYSPLEGRHTCILDWLSKPHDLEEVTRKAGVASPERLLETYGRWVIDPADVETFDAADRELSAELASAEAHGHYPV